MKSQFISIRGIKIHFITYGKGPPLLFLHGHRSDALRFKKITDRLIKRYKVIVPDLPGFGKSECLGKTHSLINFTPYLEGFVERLRLENYILTGVSLGASLALLFLQITKTKVRKVVLFGPILDKEFLKFSKIYLLFAKGILKIFLFIPGLTNLVDKIVNNDFLIKKIIWLTLPKNLRTKEVVEYEIRQWRNMSMKVWAEVCLSMLSFSLPQKKPSNIPALFILAGQDKYFDVERTEKNLKELFPKSEVIILKGKKHVDPGEISDQMLDDLGYIFDKI